MTKVCSNSYRPFLENDLYLPCTEMGSGSTHTIETIHNKMLSSIKLNLLIFLQLFDQQNNVLL